MKFIQAPRIHSKQTGGVVVILEKNKRFMRELNNTARVIWSTLRTPQSFERIVTRLRDEFDVTRSQAEKDVAEFLEEYQQAGLIQSVAE